MPDTWDEAACRARLAAVTPGPWEYQSFGSGVTCGVIAQCNCPLDYARSSTVAMEPDRPHVRHDIVILMAECDVEDEEMVPDFEQYKRDLQFIAHAPTDLGAALAALDAARAEIGRLEADLCGLSGWVRAQFEIRSGRVGACPECDRLREMARGLWERVVAQSELLSCRAEGRP